MANLAEFTLVAMGNSTQIEEFINISLIEQKLEAVDIFQVDLYSSPTAIETDCYTLLITGECKWSATSALNNVFYNDYVSLEEMSVCTGVSIEVKSAEISCDFVEHFTVDNGETDEISCTSLTGLVEIPDIVDAKDPKAMDKIDKLLEIGVNGEYVGSMKLSGFDDLSKNATDFVKTHLRNKITYPNSQNNSINSNVQAQISTQRRGR
ncbi:MAG: hypothetical protein LBI63_03250 [Candidatus Ancillula sp.]|jgi:hypothetical protein|nr:hypothetical protein [Candidatus Ancillula sp.]